jgi:hypothetical protein
MKNEPIKNTAASVIFILLILFTSLQADAQTYLTRNGEIGFYSKTPLEDISAENKQASAAIDLSQKSIAIAVLIKSFLFQKQLMQDHFNENYAESDKFPKANFTGKINGLNSTDPGIYKVKVEGNLTFHGVTRPVSTPAELEISPDKVSGKTTFYLTPADYNIKIPSIVKDKIANQITVKVSMECPLKK